MPDNTNNTIKEQKLEEEEFLVLHFSPSSSSRTVSGDTIRSKDSVFYFFQVVDTAELVYKPIVPRDESGLELDAIGPDSGTDYDQLRDENGDDILRNTDDDFRVYHYSVGVRQPDIRVYPRIPDSNEGGAFSWLSGSEPDPAEGDSVGYVNSEETDFDEPSTQLEHFSYKQDALTSIQYGFYNESGSIARKPVVSVVGYGYELRPVYQEEDMLQILAQLGKDPSERELAVTQVDFTPTSLRTFTYNTPSDWNSAENNLEVSEANLPTTIERELGIGQGSGNVEDTVDGVGDNVDIPRAQD